MNKKEKSIRIGTDLVVQNISNVISTACDLSIPGVSVTGNVPLIAGTIIIGTAIKIKSRRFEVKAIENIINHCRNKSVKRL